MNEWRRSNSVLQEARVFQPPQPGAGARISSLGGVRGPGGPDGGGLTLDGPRLRQGP